MKRPLLFVALLLCFGLSSCQCSEKPPIGPVEDSQSQVMQPDAALTPVASIARA